MSEDKIGSNQYNVESEMVSTDGDDASPVQQNSGKIGAVNEDCFQAEDSPPLAQFEELDADCGIDPEIESKLDVIMDIPVTVSMEIGRKQLSIRNLLQLNQGSIIELDCLVGEPIDVLVNGALIARGEVVVVSDKFGIRLLEVISASDRVKNLK